jgi:hypothetical protein
MLPGILAYTRNVVVAETQVMWSEIANEIASKTAIDSVVKPNFIRARSGWLARRARAARC